MSELKQRLV